MHSGGRRTNAKYWEGRQDYIRLQAQWDGNSITRVSTSLRPIKWHCELWRDYWFSNDTTATRPWAERPPSASSCVNLIGFCVCCCNLQLSALQIRWLKRGAQQREWSQLRRSSTYQFPIESEEAWIYTLPLMRIFPCDLSQWSKGCIINTFIWI